MSSSSSPLSRLLTGLGFADLLRVAWIAAILPILVASMPIKSLAPFHRALSSFAARGKTADSSSSPPSRRRRSPFAVPQSYFLHFYVVAFALTACSLTPAWLCACRAGSVRAWRTVFLLLLMGAQIVRRLYETLYVFRYSPSARMHVIGYFAGLFFYTVAPLSIGGTFALDALSYACGQISEFIVKGRQQIPMLQLNWWEALKPLANLERCQWIGFVVFIWGWLHQLTCHSILGSLREHRRADEYVIPHGDWFEYVSCPHYFAEIVIYAGILVASGGSDVTIWLLFVFVVANLVFAAAESHRWYCHKFDNYPRSRRAIIPLIY